MAEKLLTLIQDTTGDEIYPNIKEDNIPPSVRGELQKIDTKQDKLTNTQMYAVNSGITQYKVATYDGYNTTITKLNNDLTDAVNEINNKQDKIFTSTANPFVLTEDGTGIDLHKLQFTDNGILKIGDVVTQIPSDTYIQGELDNKQDTLISGTNIKTLNGQSILGSGDLPISGGEGGISVIELTDINGTIASTQLDEINANPQNFAFKYNERILLFSSASSTTYQYCKNTTNSSENNVITVTTLLTIELSTGNYTIAENAHNVVANSTHPANGGDLTNIQVGSKVYSIPSGGGGSKKYLHTLSFTAYFSSDLRKSIHGTMTVVNDSPNKITSISSASEYKQSTLFNSNTISLYGLYYEEYDGTKWLNKMVIYFSFLKNDKNNFFCGKCINNIENGNITIGDLIYGKSFSVSSDSITEL